MSVIYAGADSPAYVRLVFAYVYETRQMPLHLLQPCFQIQKIFRTVLQLVERTVTCMLQITIATSLVFELIRETVALKNAYIKLDRIPGSILVYFVQRFQIEFQLKIGLQNTILFALKMTSHPVICISPTFSYIKCNASFLNNVYLRICVCR